MALAAAILRMVSTGLSLTRVAPFMITAMRGLSSSLFWRPWDWLVLLRVKSAAKIRLDY
jgi:hypothetical protein